MSDFEIQFREAMHAAVADAQPPPGVMELVRQRHRLHVRRLGAGCLAVVAAVGFAVPALGHVLRAGPSSHGSQKPAPPAFTAPNPAPSPAAAPGTFLLTCESANWGRLPADWRTGSLKAGPIWLVGGQQQGWVHDGASTGPVRARRGHGKPSGGVMIVEVASGSTVIMRVTPAARPYFRFVDGFNGPSDNNLPSGDFGFTFIACPRGSAGPNGHVTDFYLGFASRAGSRAPVDVWTSPSSSRPIRIVFTPR